MSGFLDWWDGAELWLSGLGFVPQTLIVMPIVLVLAYGIALTLNAVLGFGLDGLRRLRGYRSGQGQRR
ncbi:MAG: hypothetical protein KDB50_15240 [Mycobacterium sp.]|nr:hypothetical protein [Mycobacterium sp.]